MTTVGAGGGVVPPVVVGVVAVGVVEVVVLEVVVGVVVVPSGGQLPFFA